MCRAVGAGEGGGGAGRSLAGSGLVRERDGLARGAGLALGWALTGPGLAWLFVLALASVAPSLHRQQAVTRKTTRTNTLPPDIKLAGGVW